MFSSTNHFVIRNGKIVSKLDAQTQSNNIQSTPVVSIIKPAATIIQHLPQLSNLVNSNGVNVTRFSQSQDQKFMNTGVGFNNFEKQNYVQETCQQIKQNEGQQHSQKKQSILMNKQIGNANCTDQANDDNWKIENYKEINKLCQYYEVRIRKYEDKIKQLQKQINKKDIIINKLNKQKIQQKQREKAIQNYKQKQSEGISTARDSRQSITSLKQNNNNNHKSKQQNGWVPPTSISSSCLKLKIKDILAARKQQQQQQQQYLAGNSIQDGKHIKQEDQIRTQSKLCDSKLEGQQQQLTQTKKQQRQQIQREIDASSLAVSVGKTDSLIEMHSISSMRTEKSMCQDVSIEKQNRTFFDTSTLMDRLNKSASLVRNIKKFLQPSGCPKSPQQQEQQLLQQTQILNKHPSIIPCTSTTHIQQPSSSHVHYDSNKSEQQYQQFIEELIQKNEQILCLIQELTLQKDQQIREIKKYYEDAFHKILSMGRIDSLNVNNINFPHDFSNEIKQNHHQLDLSSSTVIRSSLMEKVERNASKRFSRMSSRKTLKKYIEVEPSQPEISAEDCQNKQNMQIQQSKSELFINSISSTNCNNIKQLQILKLSSTSTPVSPSLLQLVSNQNVLKQSCEKLGLKEDGQREENTLKSV